MTRRKFTRIILVPVALLVLLSGLLAGQHRGMRGRGGMSSDHREDMATIHALFGDAAKIERKITRLFDGVETVTESTDPEVAARIVNHTYAMKERLEQNRPIRSWDPLFAALFANASKIRMEITKTDRGVRVKETSTDPGVVKLIQAHADAVSDFIDKGMPAMHERHKLP
jgi:uncharacterized protein